MEIVNYGNIFCIGLKFMVSKEFLIWFDIWVVCWLLLVLIYVFNYLLIWFCFWGNGKSGINVFYFYNGKCIFR